MRVQEGRIAKINLDPAGRMTAWIECAASAVPAPGRFCRVTPSAERLAVLPAIVFAGEASEGGFLAVGDLPWDWTPGLAVRIHGPLGRGFRLPAAPRRLALAVCGDQSARLMALAQQAARLGADIAWFSDLPLPALPAAQEVNPLSLLPDAPAWADLLALDLPLALLPELRARLGLPQPPLEARLPCLAQALIEIPMPCGGAAGCGACAVPLRRGWKLACLDGPVFDLEALAW